MMLHWWRFSSDPNLQLVVADIGGGFLPLNYALMKIEEILLQDEFDSMHEAFLCLLPPT